jgi:hypothetical protein
LADVELEKFEKTHPEISPEVLKKVLGIIGMDPNITVQMLMENQVLRFDFLKCYLKSENKLTKEEEKQVTSLAEKLSILLRRDILPYRALGSLDIKEFNRDIEQEFKQKQPELALRREERKKAEERSGGSAGTRADTGNRTASDSQYSDERAGSDRWSNAGSMTYVGGQDIASLPVGKRVRIDEDTSIVLRRSGSVSIFSQYSNETMTIPPAKAKIALGFISVAKIFPGLDFMGSLREVLQSNASHPLLSKMKDGSTNRERCDLIKFFSETLGITGYNANADTPEALIQSIKNCLPIGKSFPELAREK